MEAWAPGVLQDAVDQCTNLSGNMEDCPVFTYNSDPGSCGLENALPAEIASEDVKGPMQGLPNRVQVQSGPELASKPAGSISGPPSKEAEPPKNPEHTPETTPTAIAKIPTVPVSDSSQPSSSQEVAADHGSENRLAQQPYSVSPKAPSKTAEAPSSSPSTSTSAPAPTTTPDEPPVALQAGEAITTAYWTSGRQAHEVIVILEQVTVTTDGGKVTKTVESDPQVSLHKRQHKHHNHHVGRGIGGRKMK